MSVVPRWRFGDDPAPLRQHVTAGGVLAVPTESSYGLAADARSADGVEAIYRIKERDRGKPLPVILARVEQLADLGVDPDDPAVRAIAPLWPSALTLVAAASTPPAAGAGGATLAVRVPAHDGLRALLRDVGCAMTATSANRAGESPVLDPADLDALLDGHPAIVVDGGVLAGGPPSTLVAPPVAPSTNWQILRHGRFDPSHLPAPCPDSDIAPA